MTCPTFHSEPPVVLLTPAEAEAAVPTLGALLTACLEDGAGIGFMLPITRDRAEGFWTDRIAELARKDSYLLAARADGGIAGVVMLCLVQTDNGGHRAEVAKLMVHPDHRRKGLARKLMAAIDALALSLGRWLLVLDTVTGDRAEQLYPTCGYVKAGVIPDYAYGSHGHLDATTVFYKDLR